MLKPLREALDSLTVEQWDRIGYVLLVGWTLIEALSDPMFMLLLWLFGCAAVIGGLLWQAWWADHPRNED